MKVLATFVLALLLHATLGWAWTLAAAFAGGFWTGRRGWLTGLLGVGLDYLAWLLYDYAVAGRSTAAMADTLGALLGNLPGVVIVAITLLIGLLLGALGGSAGTRAALLFRRSD